MTVRLLQIGARMCLTVGALAVSGLSAAETKIVADATDGAVRYRCIIGSVPSEEFIKNASDLLRSKGVSLGAVETYGTLQDRFLAGPEDSYECGYDTKQTVKGANLPGPGWCPEVSQLLKIGSSMVYRRSTRGCQRSTHIIGGGSPLELSVDGVSVDVVHVSFRGGPGSSHVAIQFCTRTSGPLSEDLAKAVARRIKALTGVSNMVVALRRDANFLNQCGFPAIFPFAPEVKLSKKDFQDTEYVSCTVGPTWFGCFKAKSY